jgi:hypothetical protein
MPELCYLFYASIHIAACTHTLPVILSLKSSAVWSKTAKGSTHTPRAGAVMAKCGL